MKKSIGTGKMTIYSTKSIKELVGSLEDILIKLEERDNQSWARIIWNGLNKPIAGKVRVKKVKE